MTNTTSCNHEFVIDTILQIDENFEIFRQIVKGAKPYCKKCGYISDETVSTAP